VNSYDFANGSNDHRKPVLLLEEKEGSGYQRTVAGRGETYLDSRLKLKTRRLWDGSLHRETQKNPRPQGERILR
jgi:hypothetical protein